jgi:Spy/CpxP family protein refolding chaperone
MRSSPAARLMLRQLLQEGAVRATLAHNFPAACGLISMEVTMPRRISLRNIPCFAMLTLYLAACAVAANAQDNPPTTTAPPPRAHQEPCWRQAGIDRSVMEQHRTIDRDAHAQINAMCENSSLTPRQKKEQAREIRRQAKEKMDALLTPDQQKSLQACQEARAADRPHAEHHNGGPCGSEQSPQAPASAPTGKAEGSNPQPPENNSPPQN